MVELRLIANNHTPGYHILAGDVFGKDNVEHVRRKINATYEVIIPDDTKGPQNPADEDHWRPRVWPLENVMKI